MAFATSLIGPFFTEQSMISMNLGLALTGFFEATLTIPNMPEMMMAMRESNPDCDHDHAYSLLSGMLTASFGTGQALGPLLGALFYQMSDFRMTMNILAAITCTYAFIYIACAKGCDAFR